MAWWKADVRYESAFWVDGECWVNIIFHVSYVVLSFLGGSDRRSSVIYVCVMTAP